MKIRRWVISLGSRRQFPVLFVLAFYTVLSIVAFMLVYYIHASGNRESPYRKRRKTHEAESRSAPFTYRVHHQGMELEFESLLPQSGSGNEQLRERVKLPDDTWTEGNASILLMWDLSFGQKNLRGCPDWNCQVTTDRTLLPVASAVFIASPSTGLKQQHPYQYFVHYSQESPLHSPSYHGFNGYYNLSFSYRSGTPAFSPYGYTAKLAPASRRPLSTLMKDVERVVDGKSKAVAWFVSHCTTATRRERVVEELKVRRTFRTSPAQPAQSSEARPPSRCLRVRFSHALRSRLPLAMVGWFRSCGGKACKKADKECWELLDKEYYFYYAAENSLCTDYITEKLWNQGYFHLVVPIVLRRKIVERFLPPNSFIAVDDFASVSELAAHLRHLMESREDYLKYFHWRTDYEVIPLDDKSDPSVERPYGFCQVCRLTRIQPPPTSIIEDMEGWWSNVCEVPQSGLVDDVIKADEPQTSTADGQQPALGGGVTAAVAVGIQQSVNESDVM